ncbi:hypothetical protein OG2516_13731 [Oceanicola granulosus HTCC2516]|uniref:Cytochrome P460 domain-containing protein n=1 Tax=Oceanicola granulosus (strain ATCC BAA-861 / DSM 15982 / KCTC 12143 / HTCC2516) TaxID=314256 RepID=Q2CE01_OCEGH|nr:hypothetical protein [Oceanicola granulosus]EAR50937.1 hypothetical protein OG2516_13731 [Oceanicola granulosus HTCC2516]
MRTLIAAAALGALATTAIAQQAGTEADQDYAAQIWAQMIDSGFAGEGAVMSHPYPGTDPHGMMLETYYTEATVDGHTGQLIIKRNYGPEGVSADEVLAAPEEHLGAVTIMFQREAGYDPDTNNWFYAKYLPDGTLDQNPAGMALAGLVGKGADAGCIACHSAAPGEDFLFLTDPTTGSE